MILLVVGSAVTCPDRSHHISRILSTTDIKESSIIRSLLVLPNNGIASSISFINQVTMHTKHIADT